MRKRRLLFFSLLNFIVWCAAGNAYSFALAIAYVLELILDITGADGA